MIRYALRCERGHEFESWFPSSAAYEKQERAKWGPLIKAAGLKGD